MAVSENTRILPVARRHLFAAFGLLATVPVVQASAAVAPVVPALAAPTEALAPAPKIALALADMKAAAGDVTSAMERLAALCERGAADPDALAADLAVDQAEERLADAQADLAEAKSRTAADLRAKAEALCVAMQRAPSARELVPLGAPPVERLALHDRLALSLAGDILALLPAGRAA